MKKFLINILAALNMFEGVIHIVTSVITFWGIYDQHITDWRVWTAPSFDLILGVVSIITSIVLKKITGHHHHHFCPPVPKENEAESDSSPV